jgi:hypothetical protein
MRSIIITVLICAALALPACRTAPRAGDDAARDDAAAGPAHKVESLEKKVEGLVKKKEDAAQRIKSIEQEIKKADPAAPQPPAPPPAP